MLRSCHCRVSVPALASSIAAIRLRLAIDDDTCQGTATKIIHAMSRAIYAAPSALRSYDSQRATKSDTSRADQLRQQPSPLVHAELAANLGEVPREIVQRHHRMVLVPRRKCVGSAADPPPTSNAIIKKRQFGTVILIPHNHAFSRGDSMSGKQAATRATRAFPPTKFSNPAPSGS